jgi:hypothetical protein
MLIDIANLDKVEVLLCLYNAAKCEGSTGGVSPIRRALMQTACKASLEDAKDEIKRRANLGESGLYKFLHVDLGNNGFKELNIDLTDNAFDATAYDNLHGNGCAKNAIAALREAKSLNYTRQPSTISFSM